jgi:hypothetical protein
VEAETPVRAHQRELSDFSILSSNVAWRRSGDEVEVEDTSDDVVLEVLATFVIDVDVHSVRVEQKDSVGCIPAMVKVNRVCT